MKQKSDKSWLGAVFGLIFVFAGLAAAYGSAGKMIIGYVASANWVEVPATIHRVELVPSYGDTTTYKVESSYSYRFDGQTYEGDRVSLSSGSDNLGSYWQNLHRNLKTGQRSNEALALVNANNPDEALLDRTLRWKSVVFASIFFVLFCGIGGAIAWASLRGTKNRDVRLQDEQRSGINSNQKHGSWMLAAFGSVFLVFGGGLAFIALPDAIRKGEYAALTILLFVFVGAGIVFHAFKQYRAYRKFGATPLFLDPSTPGVGGQLGGGFKLNATAINQTNGTATPLNVKLSCIRVSKSGKSTTRRILWQEESLVYLTRTATGFDASFLFKIPESSKSTKEWSDGFSIEWTVTVEGDYSSQGLGKLERDWEVVVEDTAAQASNKLSIPAGFLAKAEQTFKHRATELALDQVQVTEDAQYIYVNSEAGRHLVSKLLGVLVGGIFAAVGIFTITQNWWPGYIFLLIGGLIVLTSVHALGKSVNVKINKASRELHTRVRWFGLVYAKHKGDVLKSDQFDIKETSSTTSGNKSTEYFALNFKSDDKKIRIADGIEGKDAAIALKKSIVDRCFDDEPQALAA